MKRDPKLVGFSREMRREAAPAEAVMWRLLRGRRLAGFKFRRQHPIDPYIADFFCAAALLVIELDGDSHIGQETKDGARDEHVQKLGIVVARFWNTQIYDEQDAVEEEIYRLCSTRIASLEEHPRHKGVKKWTGRRKSD